MEKVSLAQKFGLFSEHWSPKVVADLNGQQVKIAKFEGEFPWHAHAEEDEMFLVVRGRMELRLRDRTVELAEGELFVVPRGVEHQPYAAQEAHVLMFEPASTLNTGAERNELTVDAPERL